MAKGGLTKGKSHAKGGIKMKVKSTGQNIEVEGGEGIINKYVMSDDEKYTFEGKEKTACEIASELNQKTGNGVKFDCAETKNTDMTPTNPETGFAKGGDVVSDKIKFLMEKEGYPQDQATAIAYSMYEKGKLARGGAIDEGEEKYIITGSKTELGSIDIYVKGNKFNLGEFVNTGQVTELVEIDEDNYSLPSDESNGLAIGWCKIPKQYAMKVSESSFAAGGKIVNVNNDTEKQSRETAESIVSLGAFTNEIKEALSVFAPSDEVAKQLREDLSDNSILLEDEMSNLRGDLYNVSYNPNPEKDYYQKLLFPPTPCEDIYKLYIALSTDYEENQNLLGQAYIDSVLERIQDGEFAEEFDSNPYTFGQPVSGKSSVVVDEDGFPLIVYHGSQMTGKFYTFKFDDKRRYAYFAKNPSYALWFANLGNGNIRGYFLNIRMPFDMSILATRDVTPEQFSEFADDNYGIEIDPKKLIKAPKAKVWQYFRADPDKYLYNTIKNAGFDGVIFVENNPSEILPDGQENRTEAYLIFKPNQAKQIDNKFGGEGYKTGKQFYGERDKESTLLRRGGKIDVSGFRESSRKEFNIEGKGTLDFIYEGYDGKYTEEKKKRIIQNLEPAVICEFLIQGIKTNTERKEIRFGFSVGQASFDTYKDRIVQKIPPFFLVSLEHYAVEEDSGEKDLYERFDGNLEGFNKAVAFLEEQYKGLMKWLLDEEDMPDQPDRQVYGILSAPKGGNTILTLQDNRVYDLYVGDFFFLLSERQATFNLNKDGVSKKLIQGEEVEGLPMRFLAVLNDKDENEKIYNVYVIGESEGDDPNEAPDDTTDEPTDQTLDDPENDTAQGGGQEGEESDGEGEGEGEGEGKGEGQDGGEEGGEGGEEGGEGGEPTDEDITGGGDPADDVTTKGGDKGKPKSGEDDEGGGGTRRDITDAEKQQIAENFGFDSPQDLDNAYPNDSWKDLIN